MRGTLCWGDSEGVREGAKGTLGGAPVSAVTNVCEGEAINQTKALPCSLFTALCSARFGKTWHQSGASIRKEEEEEEGHCGLQQQEQQHILGVLQIA